MNVELVKVTKSFGTKRALDVPQYNMAPGEIVGLVGSNGAGKTTFLRLILNLLRPDQGTITLDGNDIDTSTDWKRHTGAYLDPSFLVDYLTADEFLDFVAGLFGLSEAERIEALQPYMTFYTDEPLGTTAKFLRDLSLGNAKKIGVIAAMFIKPRLLILDEPFANLDPPSQIRLKQLLIDLNRICGTTMIISSHDLGHVTDICQRITLLERGRIVRDVPCSAATLHELKHYFTNAAAPTLHRL